MGYQDFLIEYNRRCAIPQASGGLSGRELPLFPGPAPGFPVPGLFFLRAAARKRFLTCLALPAKADQLIDSGGNGAWKAPLPKGHGFRGDEPLKRLLPLAAAGAALFSLCGCLGEADAPAPAKPIVTEGCLKDCAYEPARRLVSRYCADCHSEGGNNASHGDAWGHAIQLDTYAQWAKGSRHLRERLDPALAAQQDPPVDPMPPTGFPYQPGQAERDTLLDWLQRGSPNTASGFADSAAPVP